METESVRIEELGTLTMPDVARDRAKLISAVISPPLAAQANVGKAAVDMAAEALGVSLRQIYVLIKRHHDGSESLTVLVPNYSCRWQWNFTTVGRG